MAKKEIMTFLEKWMPKEGLCRFCQQGRSCTWSRRGRQECNGYEFSHEMDCFHLWIAHFDHDRDYRPGYENADDYPWKVLPPINDIPKFPQEKIDEEKNRVELRALKVKKYNLMQEVTDIQTGKTLRHLSEELEQVDASIKRISNK